jgi:glycosyltransferase involved in cell wall biosynthesis
MPLEPMTADPRLLVINAASLTSGGGRTVLLHLLQALAVAKPSGWRAKVFVADARDLPAAAHISYVEAKRRKSGWAGRIWLELFGLRRALRGETVDTFLSMQGANARLRARRKFVYCQNANGLVPPPWSVVFTNPRIAMLNVAYGLLYRFGIGRDPVVIVQQDWLRVTFAERFGLDKCIVAHPVETADVAKRSKPVRRGAARCEILYPLGALPHKNAETLCEAARLLAARFPDRFKVTLTLTHDENSYAARLWDRYGKVPGIAFVGSLPKAELDALYDRSDLLVFPSRIETWGLPLSEAKQHGLAILAADLPYSHETIGDYDNAGFFDPDDAAALAERIADWWSGTRPLGAVSWPAPRQPYAPDWPTLVAFILGDTAGYPESPRLGSETK